MQNNLDNFFKEKFQEREFEFNEAHWEGAAGLIETGEKWKFWKNFAWATVSVGLFFAGGIGGYYFSQESDNSNSIDQQRANQQIVTAPGTTAPKADTYEMKKEELAELSTAREATTAQNNSIGENTNTIINTNQNTTTTSTNNRTTSNRQKPTSTLTSSQPSTTSLSTTLSTTTSEQEVSGQTAEQSISENATDAISKIEASAAEAIQKPVQSNNTLSLVAEQIEHLQLAPLGLSEADLQIKTVNPTHPIIEGKPQQFYAGITAGGVSYTNLGNFSGAQAGLTFKYRMRSQLSLNADLLYHYRPGDYSFFNRGTNLIFENFGSRQEDILMRAKSLHSFELPV
ncbi:MAG: hypothetical protein AAFP02_22040, partial [Bacteroidota bacterium]